MALPKRRISKARGRKRRAGWMRLTVKNIVECPQCHEPKLPHRICPECGYYKNREVVDMSK